MQGFNGVQSGIADLRYTEATEACATRNASAQNTRDIIDSQTRGTQAILDKLCALELDGVKGQLAQAQRENVALQNAVNMATMQASQVAQTAEIRANNALTANQQGFNGVHAGIADLRYTEATEACATRNASAQNTRDIVDAIRNGDQMIMDKLCALELDGVKNQLAQAQRDNVGLQNAVNMATMQANSLATADNIVDNLYNRLKNCPVNTTPVYGNQPIFTCPQNLNSGCGCGSF
jgi:hypothetical protein